MQAVDEYIPMPQRPVDQPFLMPVEDVFSITGRGTVGTGRVERGKIKTGESVEVVGIKETQKTVCTGVEMFRKLLDEGEAGDNVGLLLRGVEKEELMRGMVICQPGLNHPTYQAQSRSICSDQQGRRPRKNHSFLAIVPSFSSVLRTLPDQFPCRKGQRWSCRETMSTWKSSCINQSLLKQRLNSLSARVVAPLDRA